MFLPSKWVYFMGYSQWICCIYKQQHDRNGWVVPFPIKILPFIYWKYDDLPWKFFGSTGNSGTSTRSGKHPKVMLHPGSWHVECTYTRSCLHIRIFCFVCNIIYLRVYIYISIHFLNYIILYIYYYIKYIYYYIYILYYIYYNFIVQKWMLEPRHLPACQWLVDMIKPFRIATRLIRWSWNN
jgi:hypothetical protein